MQKRCMRIIFPNLSHNDALDIAAIERLSVRREMFVRELFNEMKCHNHIINGLLPLRANDAKKSRI